MSDPVDTAVEHMRHAHRLLLRARPHIDYALGHYLEWALLADVEEARSLLDAIDALRLETQRLGPAGGQHAADEIERLRVRSSELEAALSKAWGSNDAKLARARDEAIWERDQAVALILECRDYIASLPFGPGDLLARLDAALAPAREA